MDGSVMLKALEVLQSNGLVRGRCVGEQRASTTTASPLSPTQATVVPGATLDETGVKFADRK